MQLAVQSLRELVRSGPDRDLRLDLVRGLALLMIFIDHAPGNVIGSYTLRRFVLFDCADVFMILAGYGAGLFYGKVLDRKGWAAAFQIASCRSSVLYAAHLLTLFGLCALVAATGSPEHSTEMRMGLVSEHPLEALCRALSLGYQPFNADILPVYVIMFALVGLAAPLLRRPVLLLAGSLAVWAAAWFFGWRTPGWPEGTWTFEPLSWQVLFLGGSVLGYRPPFSAPRIVPFRWSVALLCLLVLLIPRLCLAVQSHPELLSSRLGWLAELAAQVPRPNTLDKALLSPLRLLSVFAAAYLFLYALPRDSARLRSRFVSPILIVGQHSLPAFCTGVCLSFLMRMIIERAEGSWTAQLATTATGCALLLGLAVALAARPRSLMRTRTARECRSDCYARMIEAQTDRA